MMGGDHRALFLSPLAIAASPRCSGREHCLAWMCVICKAGKW